MSYSEKWLQKALKNNPSLRVSAASMTQLAAMQSTAGMPKYGNSKVYVYEDGWVSALKSEKGHGDVSEVYDSEKEYKRWGELQLLQGAGAIKNLERQKRLLIQEPFVYSGERVNRIEYIADFVYTRTADGICVVEDVKAFDEATQKYRLTEAFSLKWKLLKHRYPEYRFELY